MLIEHLLHLHCVGGERLKWWTNQARFWWLPAQWRRQTLFNNRRNKNIITSGSNSFESEKHAAMRAFNQEPWPSHERLRKASLGKWDMKEGRMLTRLKEKVKELQHGHSMCKGPVAGWSMLLWRQVWLLGGRDGETRNQTIKASKDMLKI